MGSNHVSGAQFEHCATLSPCETCMIPLCLWPGRPVSCILLPCHVTGADSAGSPLGSLTGVWLGLIAPVLRVNELCVQSCSALTSRKIWNRIKYIYIAKGAVQRTVHTRAQAVQECVNQRCSSFTVTQHMKLWLTVSGNSTFPGNLIWRIRGNGIKSITGSGVITWLWHTKNFSWFWWLDLVL